MTAAIRHNIRISDSPVLKSEIFRVILSIFITLGVLAGAGYAWLWKTSYVSAQYYEAKALADVLQGQFDRQAVELFHDRKCVDEDDCIEVSIANYMADPAVQEKVVGYVSNSCNGDTTNHWPCRRNEAGLLRKVNLYFYVEPYKPCVRRVEIHRNHPAAVVVRESCGAR